MKSNNIGYLMREGFRVVFIHGFRSFAAICVTVACLIIMGSFCLISFNLGVMVNDLEEENQVLVYIDDSYTESESKSVGSQINMLSNVEQAEFISRQTALENFISEQDDPTVFAGVSAETLRDRFAVTLTDNNAMKETVEELKKIPGVADVSAHYEISDGFQTVHSVLNLASAAIIIILVVVSLFIISNTIKLAMYDRKDEIAIMRMIGATNSFIRFPFLVEGMILGISGGIIAFFLEWGLYDLLASRIQALDTLQMFNVIPFTQVFWPLLVAYVLMGFLVGVFGSMLSISKFLKV